MMEKSLFLILFFLLLGAYLSCSQKQTVKHVGLIGLDGWASMFMGAGPELHGYTEWGSRVPELSSCEVDQEGIFSTVFGLFHRAQPEVEMETPFIISGKDVKRGYAFTESMMQFDCSSTIAYIFGLDQPQVWTSRPMTQIFK